MILRDTDLPDVATANVQLGVALFACGQTRHEMRKVKEDAIRIVNAFGVEDGFVGQLDHDAGDVGFRGETDIAHGLE